MKEPQVKGNFVGIGVSMEKLDIYIRPSGESWTHANGNFKRLCSRLREVNPELIVLVYCLTSCHI